MRPTQLSIVVPIYNERDNITFFHNALADVLDALDMASEVIYVDDGSTDGSAACLAEVAAADARVRVITFRRNFGQTAAISAGIDHSAGDVIVTLDGDCQNDPRDIPRLLAKLSEGFDLVSGWRIARQDGRLRTLVSKVANRIIARTTGVRLHDYGCTLKAYRREVATQLRLYGEMHRFIPAYAAMLGADIAELPVSHHPRVRGKSKYGFNRTYRVLMDLLTVKFLSTYASKPLYLFGRVAGLCFGLAGLLSVVMLVQRFIASFYFIDSPLLPLAALLVVVGSQTILIGLLAELSVRTYHESQQKPTYVIRTRLGFQPRTLPTPAPVPDVSAPVVEEPLVREAVV